MSDRDQTRKQAHSLADSASRTKQQNVFDTAGNDAIRAKIAAVEAETGATASVQGKQSLLQTIQQQSTPSASPAPGDASGADVALKQAAVAARDEVILQMQLVSSSTDMLQQIQGCETVWQASTRVIELVSRNMADADLAALAAYDHRDLLQGKALSAEAQLQTQALSAHARKMGGFAPILWQLVTDQLTRAEVAVGEVDTDVRVPARMSTAAAGAPGDPRNLSAPLLRAAGVLTAARSSSVV